MTVRPTYILSHHSVDLGDYVSRTSGKGLGEMSVQRLFNNYIYGWHPMSISQKLATDALIPNNELGGLGGQPTQHENFTANLFLTPDLVDKWGNMIAVATEYAEDNARKVYRKGGEIHPKYHSLESAFQARPEGIQDIISTRIMFGPKTGAQMLRDIKDHLVVFSTDNIKPMLPQFIGSKAARLLQRILNEEGRTTEASLISNFLRESNRENEIIPLEPSHPARRA